MSNPATHNRLAASLASPAPSASSHASNNLPVRALRLEGGDLWSSPDHPGTLRIGCVTGAVWVSQTGQLGDVDLGPGDVCLTNPTGKVVICCFKDALILLDGRAGAAAAEAAHSQM